MDMWVSHATRRRPCVTCTVQIKPGDEVMIGQFKRTYPWGTRTRRTMSHLDCWIFQAHLWLEDHPYTPPTLAGPGRPIKYTPKQVCERKNLNMKILRWGKKQREYIGEGLWATADNYSDRVAQAREELASM